MQQAWLDESTEENNWWEYPGSHFSAISWKRCPKPRPQWWTNRRGLFQYGSHERKTDIKPKIAIILKYTMCYSRGLHGATRVFTGDLLGWWGKVLLMVWCLRSTLSMSRDCRSVGMERVFQTEGKSTAKRCRQEKCCILRNSNKFSITGADKELELCRGEVEVHRW